MPIRTKNIPLATTLSVAFMRWMLDLALNEDEFSGWREDELEALAQGRGAWRVGFAMRQAVEAGRHPLDALNELIAALVFVADNGGGSRELVAGIRLMAQLGTEADLLAELDHVHGLAGEIERDASAGACIARMLLEARTARTHVEAELCAVDATRDLFRLLGLNGKRSERFLGGIELALSIPPATRPGPELLAKRFRLG